MKTKIIVFTFAVLISAATAFAGNTNSIPSRDARESFEKEYPGALFSKWEYVDDENIYAVRFVHNNQSLVVYYKDDGTSLGFARIITPDKLPAKVKQSITAAFGEAEVSNIQELGLERDHIFYFDVVSKKDKYAVSVYDNGKIKKRKKA